MPHAPDALLGRIVTLSTHNRNAWMNHQCRAIGRVDILTRWRIIELDTSADRIWFRSVATGLRQREPSTLSWFWKQVGDGSLILE